MRQRSSDVIAERATVKGHTLKVLTMTIALVVSGMAAAAQATELLAENKGWQVGRFVNDDGVPACIFGNDGDVIGDGTDLRVIVRHSRAIAVTLRNSSWSMPLNEEYSTTVRTGFEGGTEVRGSVARPDQLFLYVVSEEGATSLIRGLFYGSYLTVPIPGKRFEASLAGNMVLVDAWRNCTSGLSATSR